MTFLTPYINLYRIIRMKNKTAFDKGLLRHLSVNPDKRGAVKAWHIGHKVSHMEANR